MPDPETPTRPGDGMRKQLRAAPHQLPSVPTTYGPPWAVAAWLGAGVALVLPAALLLRQGFTNDLVVPLVLLGSLALPCSIALVLVGLKRWRRRWRLDPTGFAGEGYAFRWEDVERFDVHLTLPENTGAHDHWLEVTVRLANGDVCGLEADGFERALALLACAPPERRQVR